MDIGDWLRGLGLGQYEAVFRSNDIDADLLPEVTADDLVAIGVSSVGHRRKLLTAISALKNRPSTPPEAVEAVQQTPAALRPDAERRQLTVMFCDLVGSTTLATQLDPEDLREVIGQYHRTLATAIAPFEGFVAKYMGDGALVYFGYPNAHEDDAERAVRAALALIAATTSSDLAGGTLGLRIGIATGLSVVGDLIGTGVAQEENVIGETPNLAARLQALANPGSAVIADETRRMIGELFELVDLGPQELRGFGERQRAWRVVGESGAVSRFEALRSGMTSIIGRTEELDLLLQHWHWAKTDGGHVVLISGEPGIGKSRLSAAISEHIENEPHTKLRYFCAPHHQHSALYPFITQLERAIGFTRDDTAEQKLVKLAGSLGPSARSADEITLLAELLSLPNSAAGLRLSPQRKREALFEALLQQLEAAAQNRPVLIVFEDAHWIDPTSRELLDLMVDRVSRLPILLAVTARPEFHPTWKATSSYVTMLALNRLGERDATALVRELAGSMLGTEIVDEIAERADGVPLFVEELTKAVLERADQGDRVAAVLSASPAPPMSVPATLQASLLARLDRLGTAAKDVAQIGAVLGREFSHVLIERVSQRPDLEGALARLSNAGLLFCQGLAPETSYMFKHALVQDVAYSTLLRGRRRELHARVAEILKNDLGLDESQPELLAHHYSEAGEIQQAVHYWGKAGRRSVARSAMEEAAAQCRRGLEQLKLLPDSPERQRQELELLLALVFAYHALRGNGAAERGEIFARARELWEGLGYPPEFLAIPYGQAQYHGARGELDLAIRHGQDLLKLSREHNEVSGQLLGHNSVGQNLMMVGRFTEARWHLEQVDKLSSEVKVNSLANDPRPAARSKLSNVLFFLGFPGQAMERANSAIREAEQLTHASSLTLALAFVARLLSVYGDNTALRYRAEQLYELADAHGFPEWRAVAIIYRGWAALNEGDHDEGMQLMRTGLGAYHETGISHTLSFLARGCWMTGRLQEGLDLLDDALRDVENTGERRFAAEMFRYRGDLFVAQGNVASAEEAFFKSLDIARLQQAKTWELRAGMSLARLWADQGKRIEARDLLAPMYGWFTEGFDTPDLTEAKALLSALM
jgi:class 3 adenylate cyclase/tetratricopeptide (TPR) repeat protein